MDIITRTFEVQRGQRSMFYDFMTYADIFNNEHENELVQKVKAYLQEVFIHGYPDRSEKQSISSMPTILGYKAKLCEDVHQFRHIAEKSQYVGAGRDQHSVVQAYLMKFNPYVVAVEVPVWTDDTHGFIDVLAIDTIWNRIVIGDVKPDAAKEVRATSQLLRYRTALAERLGVKQNIIDLYYFDHLHIYQV